MIVYFQSINDIITNSSSEVYTLYSRATIDAIKGLVDTILSASGSDLTFDDLFTAKLLIDNDAKQDYEDSNHEWEGEPVSFEDFVEKHDEYQFYSMGETPLYAYGIQVLPKNDKAKEAAQYLSRIETLLEKATLYC